MRFPLRASVRYHWRNAHGLLCRGRGRTRNVSEEGVLIAGSNCPARGDVVDLTFRVPRSTKVAEPGGLSVEMSGQVVRLLVDAAGKTICGFAMERYVEGSKKNGKQAALRLQANDLGSSRCN